MQIEEAFRDLKSERFGLGLSASRSKHKDRLSVLLLIACLSSFTLRLIGQAAKTRQMEFQFQSNTRRSRPVLSVISLGLQLVRKNLATFRDTNSTPRSIVCDFATRCCKFEGRPQIPSPFVLSLKIGWSLADGPEYGTNHKIYIFYTLLISYLDDFLTLRQTANVSYAARASSASLGDTHRTLLTLMSTFPPSSSSPAETTASNNRCESSQFFPSRLDQYL